MIRTNDLEEVSKGRIGEREKDAPLDPRTQTKSEANTARYHLDRDASALEVRVLLCW
jgi:hypothetical protein